MMTFACPHPLGMKARTQPGFTSSVPAPPAYCRHSGCFRTQPAAPGKLKLAFSTPPQWADTGSQRDAELNPEPTTKQDKISINKLDPRSLIRAGQGAGRLLEVVRSSGLCSRHCRGRAVVQMAGESPRRTAFLAGRASVPVCPQPPNLPELACFPGFI